MRQKSEEFPEGEEQMRELEDELEHLEEDVERRGLWSKTVDLVKKIFRPNEPTGREQHEQR